MILTLTLKSISRLSSFLSTACAYCILHILYSSTARHSFCQCTPLSTVLSFPHPVSVRCQCCLFLIRDRANSVFTISTKTLYKKYRTVTLRVSSNRQLNSKIIKLHIYTIPLLQFFKYDCENPYEVMSRVDYELLFLEEEMRGIQESGSLFEVNVPEFKLLKQCRKELRMLKVRRNLHMSKT